MTCGYFCIIHIHRACMIYRYLHIHNKDCCYVFSYLIPGTRYKELQLPVDTFGSKLSEPPTGISICSCFIDVFEADDFRPGRFHPVSTWEPSSAIHPPTGNRDSHEGKKSEHEVATRSSIRRAPSFKGMFDGCFTFAKKPFLAAASCCHLQCG